MGVDGYHYLYVEAIQTSKFLITCFLPLGLPFDRVDGDRPLLRPRPLVVVIKGFFRGNLENLSLPLSYNMSF